MTDHRPLLDVGDEPEPVECPECLGEGATRVFDGRTTHREMCRHCYGEGVVEDATEG